MSRSRNKRPLKPLRRSGGKELEIRLRRLFLGRLADGGKARMVESPAPEIPLSSPPRIVLLRQDKIGDALISIPVIRELRRKLPEARIDVILGTNNRAIEPALLPFVDHIHVYHKKLYRLPRLARDLRLRRYDVAVDLMDNPSVTSSALLRLSGARYRLGIDKNNAGVYTHLVPPRDRATVHIVERIAQLLLPFDIDPSAADLRMEYPLHEGDRALAAERLGRRRGALRLAVNLAGGSPTRYWGRDNFVGLLKNLRVQFPGVEVMLFADRQYADEQAAIAELVSVRRAPVVSSFHEFAAMLSLCDALFTPDTSAVHLGAAFGLPQVALYLHRVKSLLPWTPYGTPHIALTTDAPQISSIAQSEAQAALAQLLHTHFSDKLRARH